MRKIALFGFAIMMNLMTYSNTITVVNTNDSGTGSLRDAVSNAIEGDTIKFSSSLISNGNDTITLASQILFTKGLTIKGLYNSSDTLFISGNNLNRIFYINLSPATIKNAVLDSLVLINSHSTGSGGAIFFIHGDTLFLKNSIVNNNIAAYGGGIYINSSSVCIDNSLIKGNTATTNGGGICTYSSNVYSPSIIVKNSTISENTASSGGGIFSSSVYLLSINNSTINGNSAISGRGGGIFSFSYFPASYPASSISSTSVAISNSTISGNTASTNGGGICYASLSFSTLSFSSSVVVTNSTISGNAALSGDGGGIYSALSTVSTIFSSLVDITNSTISGNTASGTGGGIHSFTPTSSSSIIKTVSSIVALNGSNNIYNSGPILVNSGGNNIFSDATISGSISNDQLGITSAQLNLGTLNYNGGSTKTVLPLLGSVAINNGNQIDLSDAQNGPISGIRDVGSAESHCISTSTGTDIQTACDTFIWIDGNTYTSSNNSATYILTNVLGCDSIVTLDLTINNSNTGIDIQTACNAYTWIDGNTYTADNNSATHTLINSTGCDSIVILNLTINNSNTGTDVQTACDTYTWIDGNTYSTSNNTATHTLTNTAGCDSVVTLDLTIINSNTGTDVQTACDTYTWIDGNIYTSSNTSATHTLTNATGCDSIVTLNLTIINSSTGTDVQTACDIYTWIDGNTYSMSNNTATHTLTNTAGCDSVVTLDLTINNSIVSTDIQVACDTYTWIDGSTYTTSNNTATYTLMTSGGCDSIITLDLIINNSSIGTDVLTACDTYAWIDGNTYTSSNNSATHILTNSEGCDSIVTLDLTIINSSTGTDVQTACDIYTWIDGNTYTTSNDFATYTLTNIVGCDSIITLDLTITSSDLSVTVSGGGISLTSNEPGAAYKWLDCNIGYSEIAGETSQTFVSTTNGVYAVEITNSNCIDTSTCTIVSSIGLDIFTKTDFAMVYPNPTSDVITISLSELENVQFELMDIQGKIIISEMVINNGEKIDMSNLENGIYFVRLASNKNRMIQRIVKN